MTALADLTGVPALTLRPPYAHLAAAAQHAIGRADDGLPPHPADGALVAAYDRHCQVADARLIEAACDQWRAELLARCCPDCTPDGTGPVCDHHEETE